MNKKGFKVLNGCGVIQGDGVNIVTIQHILDAALKEGFSAQNIAFGMGGGLLQKVNRDTMSFATKLSHIQYKDGKKRDIMKTPKTDTGKISLPGELAVITNDKGLPLVYPKEEAPQDHALLYTVYDHGRVCAWDDFDTIRQRVQHQWTSLPKKANVISDALQRKINQVKADQTSATAAMLAAVDS